MVFKMTKILKIQVEKWHKRPLGFSYYHFEKSYGLIEIDFNDLNEFDNKIFVYSIQDLVK